MDNGYVDMMVKDFAELRLLINKNLEAGAMVSLRVVRDETTLDDSSEYFRKTEEASGEVWEADKRKEKENGE